MLTSVIAGKRPDVYFSFHTYHTSTEYPSPFSSLEYESLEKCSLCVDSDLNREATVYFSGEEVSCEEFEGKIFVEEGVSSGSPRCENIQSFYSEKRCISTMLIDHPFAYSAALGPMAATVHAYLMTASGEDE